jgi:L-iditol 2-dehydrogenase
MTITTVGLGKLAPGKGNLGLREYEVPDPGPGQVLVEVIAAGICGTDLHIADDEFPSHPPVTMGHEVSGEVTAVGPGGDSSLIGGRFAIETYFSYCEVCAFCRTGSPNLCTERRSIGSHVDGGFARWLVVPARNLHPLPDTVGWHAGPLAEPLACVAHCLFDPPVVNAGDSVLVTGPGTMGVLTAQAARSAGGVVTLAGLPRDAERLAVAGRLGLHTLVLDGGDGLGAFDVVCECSGSEAGARLALASVRKGGRYVHIGILGRPVSLDLDRILLTEITYTSGFASTPRSWERAMALLAAGDVVLDPLVSAVVPLREWQSAFEATRNAEGLKFIIDPRQERGGTP